MAYPITKKQKTLVKFGNVEGEFRGSNKDKLMNPPIEVEDNYFWLRDDKRTNIEVLDHINTENKYTDFIIEPHNELKKSLYKEIKSYIRETYDGYKYKKESLSNYKYFSRYIEGKDYNLYCRINTNTNNEEILLDVNELAIGKNQCDVTSFSTSPNDKYMTYGVDFDGSEKYDFIFYDIENKQQIDHLIPKLAYCSYFWATDNLLYYLVGDEKNRLCELWLYNILNKTNILVYKELNEELDLNASMTDDEKYVMITIGDYDSNYSMYIDINEDPLKYKLVKTYEKNVKYYVEHHLGTFYILTNKDATNWKLMKTNMETDSEWETFIPYNPSIYINNISLFKNYLIFQSKINGNLYVNIYSFLNGTITMLSHLNNRVFNFIDYINFDHKNYMSNDVYTIKLGVNCIHDTNILNISFTSLTSPTKLIDYNMATLENVVVYEQIVPNYNETLYECKRLWVQQENIKIPVSIVYRKDKFKQDGSMPLYLYGYGSYGHTVDTTFSYKILPLLDRGYLYAIAHVRGGSFLGYDWYLQGKMNTKMNTFKDFIRCAEYMIEENYTQVKNIVTEGRSAGGLLIGATVTMRPELFKTVIPGVPFIDVLNTMSDSKIPLTVEEWTQWGNPNEKDDYEYMKQYCPYTNIKENEYPNMYLSGGLHDPRVPYWEPLKFLSKIREYKTDNNAQVVRMETEQGHFGGSSRYKFIDELSEMYTFVFTRD
jgi:oligopeptidase B